ncbi:MAG: IMP cyclohydrolase [bacterium]
MINRWAIFSLWDKSGAAELAEALINRGYGILATSKTAAVLKQSGINITEVGTWTGSPEILAGRVKTIHPKIAAGILSNREDSSIEPIDFVVCNLYPFAQGLSEKRELKEMVELIDIGGVTLLRAAAKNWFFVTAVPTPDIYPLVIQELRAHNSVSEKIRRELARNTFEMTGKYDMMIAQYLADIVDM